MAVKFPIRYWMNHLIFDDNLLPYAVYKIPMTNYSMLSDSEKIEKFQKMFSMYNDIERDFKILSLCNEIIPDEYAKQMRGIKHNEGYEKEYEEHIAATKHKMGIVSSWDRELYIVVQVSKISLSDRLKNASDLKEKAKVLGHAVSEFFFGQDPVIDQEFVNRAIRDEDDIYDVLRNSVGAERSNNLEIQKILNRLSTRSITPRPVKNDWSPASIMTVKSVKDTSIQPIQNTIMTTHYSYEIDETKMDRIILTHGDTGEESYQTFIQFSDYPENIMVPGGEVFFQLDRLGHPIDIAIDVKFMTADVASRKLYGKTLELQEQSVQYSESLTGAPIELRDAHGRMKLLEDKLGSKMPLIHVTTVMAVSANNETELNQRRRQVMDNTKGYFAVCAPTKQKEAFMLFMPVLNKGLESYSIPMDPGFLGATMVDATVNIGEKIGYYLGIVVAGNRQPLLIDPRVAQAENKTATTAILGNLGGGKSVLNKTLIYYMLMWGAQVIAIDPKNENFCFEMIPSVARKMKQINIGADHDASINPYKIAKGDKEIVDVVSDFLSIILQGNGTGEYLENRRIAIGKAVRIVMDQDTRDMEMTMKAFYFMAFDEDGRETSPGIRAQAEQCYSMLENYRETAIGQTFFSTEENALDMNSISHQFINFNISALPLPSEQDMENIQRGGTLQQSKLLGTAILYLIVQFARYATLFNLSKKDYKVLSLDEAWRIMATSQGADLMMEIIRMGRTYNVMPIIVTQSAADLLNEKIRNNIGMVFVFKNKDETEIMNCAKLLGIRDPDQNYVTEARSLPSGTCYFRDLYDRVAKVMIMPQPEKELLAIFDTRPEAVAKMEDKKGGEDDTWQEGGEAISM